MRRAGPSSIARDVPAVIRGWLIPCLMVVVSSGMSRCAWAIGAWELRPYEVQIAFQADPSPRISTAWQEQLADQVMQRAESLWGSVWQIEWTEVPLQHGSVAEAISQQSVPLPPEAKTEVLLLLSIVDQGSAFVVEARQKDLTTQQWGPHIRLEQATVQGMVHTMVQGLSDAFVPVAEIVAVDDQQVTVVPRAAQLLTEQSSMCALQPGDFLQPVVCQVGRTGQIEPDGTRPVAWTTVHVEEEGPLGWRCRLYSAYGQPLRRHRSIRLRQLAHPLRIVAQGTTIQMLSRSEPARPLVGYQVFGMSLDGETTYWQAMTDWRGQVRIDHSPARPSQLLLVKHGTRPLARLPVIVGAHERLTVQFGEDPAILAADAFVQSVEQELLDLMVRRQLMGLRIERLLAQGHQELAEEVLQALRRTPTQSDFLVRMQAHQQRLATSEPAVRARLDKLLADTRKLLSSVLDPGFVQHLQTQVAETRR